MGPRQPDHLQPYERRHPVVVALAPEGQSTEILSDLEHHLERLTLDIPETDIDDIPLRLQRYVIGVPGPFRRFLCRWPGQWSLIVIIISDKMIVS